MRRQRTKNSKKKVKNSKKNETQDNDNQENMVEKQNDKDPNQSPSHDTLEINHKVEESLEDVKEGGEKENDKDQNISETPKVEEQEEEGEIIEKNESPNNNQENVSEKQNDNKESNQSPSHDTLEINQVEESLEDAKEREEKENEKDQEISHPPIVVSRKRKWGSRPIKTQQSVSISTESLKNIISDVKPAEFSEVLAEKKIEKKRSRDHIERPVLPKIVIDNTNHKTVDNSPDLDAVNSHRKISIVRDDEPVLADPPSPSRNRASSILFITNLVRPFTLTQLKNLLQRTGRIVEDGFWIDNIKSKCYVKYENEEQAIETRHALHGVTWPVSNPKTLCVDFSNDEALEKAKNTEDVVTSSKEHPGTVEDWLREQDAKRNRRDDLDEQQSKDRRNALREWDVGKGEKDTKDRGRLDRDRMERRRPRSPVELSPEPVRKFKKKEDEAPAKLLDDLFRKTKATPCIYWLPLSEEVIAVKEEQRKQHMADHERRMQEMRNRNQSHRRY